jgi:hypothetical protein
MENVKEKMLEVIKAQPDDASYEEILKELAFDRMIQRGLDDFSKNQVISHEELKEKVYSWKK